MITACSKPPPKWATLARSPTRGMGREGTGTGRCFQMSRRGRRARYRAGMRRTKIVATIGPASRDPDTLLRLVEAGMDVARLNYSHGTLAEPAETALPVRDAAGRAGAAVGGPP